MIVSNDRKVILALFLIIFVGIIFFVETKFERIDQQTSDEKNISTSDNQTDNGVFQNKIRLSYDYIRPEKISYSSINIEDNYNLTLNIPEMWSEKKRSKDDFGSYSINFEDTYLKDELYIGAIQKDEWIEKLPEDWEKAIEKYNIYPGKIKSEGEIIFNDLNNIYSNQSINNKIIESLSDLAYPANYSKTHDVEPRYLASNDNTFRGYEILSVLPPWSDQLMYYRVVLYHQPSGVVLYINFPGIKSPKLDIHTFEYQKRFSGKKSYDDEMKMYDMNYISECNKIDDYANLDNNGIITTYRNIAMSAAKKGYE